VKRAFVERSLRFRSAADERGDASAANAFRLREINDAWATLRNPQARADYDECLLAAAADADTARAGASGRLAWSIASPAPSTAAVRTTSAVLLATRPAMRPADAATIDPIALEPLEPLEPLGAGESGATPSRSALRRWLPLVLTVIAVAAVLCCLARSTSHAPVARDVSIQSSSPDAVRASAQAEASAPR
jgi:hypothetical protein